MFTFDRDTALIAAVVVCIAATLYMYREFGKTKNDLYEMKNLVDKHDSYMYSTQYEEEEEEAEEPTQVQVQEAHSVQVAPQPVAQPSAQ
jgi:hypothetical protein